MPKALGGDEIDVDNGRSPGAAASGAAGAESYEQGNWIWDDAANDWVWHEAAWQPPPPGAEGDDSGYYDQGSPGGEEQWHQGGGQGGQYGGGKLAGNNGYGNYNW